MWAGLWWGDGYRCAQPILRLLPRMAFKLASNTGTRFCFRAAVAYGTVMFPAMTAAHWLIELMTPAGWRKEMRDATARRTMLEIAAVQKLARHAALVHGKADGRRRRECMLIGWINPTIHAQHVLRCILSIQIVSIFEKNPRIGA